MSPTVQVFRKTLTPVACDYECDYVWFNGALKDFSNYYASHGCCNRQPLISKPLYSKQKVQKLALYDWRTNFLQNFKICNTWIWKHSVSSIVSSSHMTSCLILSCVNPGQFDWLENNVGSQPKPMIKKNTGHKSNKVRSISTANIFTLSRLQWCVTLTGPVLKSCFRIFIKEGTLVWRGSWQP